MKLTLGLLADAANVTQEQKLNILGEFNFIRAPQFPFALASMTLVFRLEASGDEQGDHTLHLRLLDEDGNLVRALLDAPFRLPTRQVAGVPRRLQFIIPIAMALFERPGTYAFDVLVDEARPENATPIEVHVVEADRG